MFVVVWTGLYIMIGVAGWLVWRRGTTTRPLRLWGWQLAANAFWIPAFFGLHSPPLALAVSLVLLVLIVLTMRALRRVRRRGDLADGAVSGVDRLRDLPHRGLLVAQSGLS